MRPPSRDGAWGIGFEIDSTDSHGDWADDVRRFAEAMRGCFGTRAIEVACGQAQLAGEANAQAGQGWREIFRALGG